MVSPSPTFPSETPETAETQQLTSTDESTTSPELTETDQSSRLVQHPGKGKTSYFHFRSNKNVVIYKHTVLGLKFVLDDMAPEIAEEVLIRACRDASVYIGEGKDAKSAGEMFREEAKKNGMTLLEVLKEANNEIDKERKRSTTPVVGEAGLMSILACLAVNEDPEQLEKRFLELGKHMEGAKKALHECLKKNGRSEAGYIHLRKQDEVKKAARDAKRKADKQIVEAARAAEAENKKKAAEVEELTPVEESTTTDQTVELGETA